MQNDRPDTGTGFPPVRSGLITARLERRAAGHALVPPRALAGPAPRRMPCRVLWAGR